MEILLPEKKTAVVFCPHPDDDAFSCGATISEMVRKGCEVVCVYMTLSPKGVAGNMTDGEKGATRKKEGIEACRIMGSRPVFLNLDEPRLEHTPQTVKAVAELLKTERPDVIFLPPENDAHPTHRATSKIVLEALGQRKTEVWFYETWTPLAEPNFIFFFGEKAMELKKKAMNAHQSQVSRRDFPGAIVGLNIFRGIMGEELLMGFGKLLEGKKQYGEAFRVVRNWPEKGI